MTINVNLLHILIGIDDTDNLDSPGSGTLAEQLAADLQNHGLAQCHGITRHQLFVHSSIPFTSHNSAMCIPATTPADNLAGIIAFGQSFVQRASAHGSDPGFCVVIDDSRLDRETLIQYGRHAKKTIFEKQAAYDLASTLGVHLSEHGGTGGGVIGALAATGLRLFGNDGRFRGWHRFGKAGESVRVADLCSHGCVEAVLTETGENLAVDEQVVFAEDTVKTVLLGGLQVVPVARFDNGASGPQWKTMTKKEVKRF